LERLPERDALVTAVRQKEVFTCCDFGNRMGVIARKCYTDAQWGGGVAVRKLNNLGRGAGNAEVEYVEVAKDDVTQPERSSS